MKNFTKTLLVAAIFIFIAQNAMAHGGGGHKKEAAPVISTEPSATDPMYAIEEKEPDPFGSSEMFSPSDLFMEGEVVSPAGNESVKMESSHNEHENMQKVELAKLKAVTTSSKGYGIAAGITLFAGLVFAGLTFIRPGE